MYQMLYASVGYVELGGFALLIVLLIVAARRRRRLALLPDKPTVEELRELGYERGVCVAALRHLEEAKARGDLYYYRPAHADYWNVWLNHAIDPQSGDRGVRLTLGDWVHMFIVGTLPTQAQAGGAA